MTIFVIGLLLFLGAHSVRIVADGWRARQVARMGEKRWKSAFAVVSGVGFVLLIVGFGLARADSVAIWSPPPWLRYVTVIATLPAMILYAAAKIPDTRIQPWIGHPMVAGTILWALVHLLVSGRIEGLMLFGSFLLWSIMDFVSLRHRDRVANTRYPEGTVARDGIAIGAGFAIWLLFIGFFHAWLIGVNPL